MEERYQSYFENVPKIYKELPVLKTDPIIKWLKEKVFTERYLFYNKQKNEAVCSNCGNVDMPEGAKHNSFGVCPKCHSKVQFKSAGIGRGKLEGLVRVLIFQKRGKSIYATSNFIYANYNEGQVRLYKDVDGVFKMNRKEQVGYRTEYGWWYGGRWVKQTNLRIPYRTGKWKDAPIYLYTKNLKQVFKGTDLQYCELAEQANRWFVGSYLRLVDLNAKFESVEKLHKIGLDNLIESKILGHSGSRAIKWKKKDLRGILGLNKAEIAEAVRLNVDMSDLDSYKKAKKSGLPMSMEDARKLDTQTINKFKKLSQFAPEKTIYKYLKKQAIGTAYSIRDLIRDFSDYIKECKELDFDITDQTILFPRNIIEAHARTSAQISVMANPLQNEGVKKSAEKVGQFNYAENNLMIRVATNAEEIIVEGKIMGHCVGGYVKDVAEGRTYIFFVRRVENPEEPYYTLELSRRNKIYEMIQCRGGGPGKKNGSMTDEVKEFVDRWMAEVVNSAKPKRKKKVA